MIKHFDKQIESSEELTCDKISQLQITEDYFGNEVTPGDTLLWFMIETDIGNDVNVRVGRILLSSLNELGNEFVFDRMATDTLPVFKKEK
jgi:hypothetical protein